MAPTKMYVASSVIRCIIATMRTMIERTIGKTVASARKARRIENKFVVR